MAAAASGDWDAAAGHGLPPRGVRSGESLCPARSRDKQRRRARVMLRAVRSVRTHCIQDSLRVAVNYVSRSCNPRYVAGPRAVGGLRNHDACATART